jgi:2-polyprenyl-6-methoxyphenol hydroxylase-like FAD-dependent oxidoreductase
VAAQHFDIAIIGSGIAGGALASALKGSGLSILLLDRRCGQLDTARGDHIQPAMQPVLSRWGVLDPLLKAGAERRAGTRWFDAEGTHIVTVPVPQHDDCGGAFLFLNHEKIGDILLNTAEEAGAVSITGLSGWSLTRVAGNWRVDWQVADQPGSATCTVLVAADGTASTVRSRLKLGLDRHRYQYPIAVLYGCQQGVGDERTLDVYLAEGRMVSLIPRTGGATKVGFPVSPEEIGFWKTGSEEALQRRLAKWCPGMKFESLAFGAIYPPVSQQSKPYQGQGALVLIGDARHAMHPARSMGMNTCFRVADQLADSLTSLNSGFSEAQVLPLLAEFEARVEQELTPRLAENHAAGLQMDTITGGGFAELREQLQVAAGDDRILGAMALKAAGLTV